MEALGVQKPALIVGTGVYARELAAEVVAEARERGIEPGQTEDLRDDPDTVLNAARDLADQPADARPDGVVLALARDRYTPQMLAGLSRGLPRAELLTGSGILVGQPLVAAAGSTPPPLEAVAPQPPPGPSRVLRRIARTQGADLAAPEALWGYEAVRVVLDAIRTAQRNGRPANRAEVVRAALAPRVRRSPIGTYQVRRNGAVEGLPMALYRLHGDRFEFVRAVF
jgi:hypothetical protein